MTKAMEMEGLGPVETRQATLFEDGLLLTSG
jgi:hypothetical protein